MYNTGELPHTDQSKGNLCARTMKWSQVTLAPNKGVRWHFSLIESPQLFNYRASCQTHLNFMHFWVDHNGDSCSYLNEIFSLLFHSEPLAKTLTTNLPAPTSLLVTSSKAQQKTLLSDQWGRLMLLTKRENKWFKLFVISCQCLNLGC